MQLRLPASDAAQSFAVAQDLAAGYLGSADACTPAPMGILVHAYDRASRGLTDCLIAVTVLSAAVVDLLLDGDMPPAKTGVTSRGSGVHD